MGTLLCHLSHPTTLITDHFHQTGHKTTRLSPDTCYQGSCFTAIIILWRITVGSDLGVFDPYRSILNFLPNFPPDWEVTVSDVLTFFWSCSSGQLELMSPRLLFVMPATNARSEWPFNVVQCIKMYLHSPMSWQWFNHLILLHINVSHTDELGLVDVESEVASTKHNQTEIMLTITMIYRNYNG